VLLLLYAFASVATPNPAGASATEQRSGRLAVSMSVSGAGKLPVGKSAKVPGAPSGHRDPWVILPCSHTKLRMVC
jgi:hypothetical protein